MVVYVNPLTPYFAEVQTQWQPSLKCVDVPGFNVSAFFEHTPSGPPLRYAGAFFPHRLPPDVFASYLHQGNVDTYSFSFLTEPPEYE